MSHAHTHIHTEINAGKRITDIFNYVSDAIQETSIKLPMTSTHISSSFHKKAFEYDFYFCRELMVTFKVPFKIDFGLTKCFHRHYFKQNIACL